jgi:hypothetical protein
MDSWLAEMRTWQKGTMACQEVTEACLESKEPASVQIESESEHQEALKEEVAVETLGAPKERYGGTRI